MSAEDDPLMEQLGDAAREREPDPRWDEYARGRLSPEELEALRETTASDEEYAMLEALFRPLSDRELAADVEGALDRIAIATPARRPSRARVGFAAAGVVLAAAAAALLALGPDDPPTPRYALHLAGGAQVMRGIDAPDAPRLFRAGSRIEIVLRPEVEADPAVGVVTFARDSGGVRRVRVEWERASSGAFRIAGDASQLDLPDGAWTLVFVVGPIERLPADGEPADALRSARTDAALRVLEAPVRLELGR